MNSLNVCFWTVLIVAAFANAMTLNHDSSPVTYICENETAIVGCEEGAFVAVIKANYGRTSATICPKPGNTKFCWSTNATELVTNQCDGRQSCTLVASNTIYGDPCPENYKYLEVHYTCG